LLLKPSKALDALRRANLPGSLRDAVVLLLGAGLVIVAPSLPFAQEITFMIIGVPLMVSGAAFLILREIRSIRAGIER
jgi:hypothetical protein